MEIHKVVQFDYTGQEEQITLDPGDYILECWGAQGGSNVHWQGGLGGYSRGWLRLIERTTIYINVGGEGTSGIYPPIYGGYNGGGQVNSGLNGDHTSGSGGGATHIALVSGLLRSLENQKGKIIMVAGAGGGAYFHDAGYAQYKGANAAGGGF